MALLEVKGLRVSVAGSEILKGVDLTIRDGEVHAIMGPNGSGKSTLAQVLAGHPAYTVVVGTAQYDAKDLLAMKPEERARAGVFLAFQYPVEIRGITNSYFLRSALNALRRERGEPELDPIDFLQFLEQKLKAIGWDDSMMNRPVKEGFSGGEKKRSEIRLGRTAGRLIQRVGDERSLPSAGLAQGPARERHRSLRRSRLPQHEAGGVALHERRADRRRIVRAGAGADARPEARRHSAVLVARSRLSLGLC